MWIVFADELGVIAQNWVSWHKDEAFFICVEDLKTEGSELSSGTIQVQIKEILMMKLELKDYSF